MFVGQFHGAGARERCADAFAAAGLLALVSWALCLPLAPLGAGFLALALPAADVLERADAYYGVLMRFGGFVFLQTAAAAYFTGRGRTRIVFAVNLAGNLLNVALDPVFIFGWWGVPRMGIAGAACATVLSTAVQAAVLVAAGLRETGFRRRRIGDMLPRIVRFGVPSGLYELLNMTSFAIFVFVTAGVGEVGLAASNACFTVNYLLFAPMMGFSLGAQTLVAQAIGRGDPDGAALAAKRTLRLAILFVAVPSLLVLVFAHPVLSIFAAETGAAADEFHRLGFTLLLLMTAWQLFDATDVVLSGALKGAGDTKFVMWWMLAVSFGVWLPLVCLVRAHHNTMPALWTTMIVDVLVIFAGTARRWFRGGWRSIRIV